MWTVVRFLVRKRGVEAELTETGRQSVASDASLTKKAVSSACITAYVYARFHSHMFSILQLRYRRVMGQGCSLDECQKSLRGMQIYFSQHGCSCIFMKSSLAGKNISEMGVFCQVRHKTFNALCNLCLSQCTV